MGSLLVFESARFTLEASAAEHLSLPELITGRSEGASRVQILVEYTE